MTSTGERQRPPRPPPPVVADQTSNGVSTYTQIKQINDAAFRYIDEGLSLDERGQTVEAIDCYAKGLEQIERAKGYNSNSPEIPLDKKESVRKMLMKMTKSKLQIECRLENLLPPTPGALTESGACAMLTDDQPPSYEQATSEHSFMELGETLHNEESAASNSMTANATEMYSIGEGVQIFYITPEGYVSAPSYPSSLRAYQFNNEAEVPNPMERPPAFLQVGDWFYPLVPGISPALHSTNGAYIFPDVNNPQSGYSVGLIIPEHVSAEEKQKFEDMMMSLTALRQQELTPTEEQPSAQPSDMSERTVDGEKVERPKEDPTMSSKISHGIIVAADWVSWGVNKGAEKAGAMIRRGSTQLQQHIKPEEKPREIPDKYQKGIEKVRNATHVAVSVSSYVVGKLGQATAALGRQLAPHVRKQGERLLPRSLSQKGKDGGQSKMDGFVEVAASSLHGFGTIYMGLESAAKALAKSLATETVQVVNHKYGADAAKFADHTLYSTGNLAMTGYNVNHLGVKAVAKRAAKDTGKAVLMDLKKSDVTKENKVPAENGEFGEKPKTDPNTKT